MIDYNTPNPRETNLPRWAQEKISNLRLRVATLETRLQQIVSGKEPSSFWYEDLDYNRYYIPRLCRLKFTDGTIYGEISIDASSSQSGRGGLYLNGSGGLTIFPSAANAVYVRSER